MNKYKSVVLISVFIVLTLLLTSCLPGGGSYSPIKPAGFFSGIWHGWVAPVSLILGLFNSKISIYESFNTGWWYDFGFYISIIAGFGSIQLIRKKRC
ncbi:hypothetical protein DMA11_04765 [Marinilabiliaceae bacterium JC017]|nr:hypothetical protein DMA11_04765 [Marinilabiliaceae bacterium JC017]